MTSTTRTPESRVKLGEPHFPVGVRSGGESRPLEYPHLYQIQAGDWRISYAVEHNRLAILVLEVLGAEGESSKDPMREKLTQKMKIKLLDWPEGSGGGQQMPPEDITKKLKIKWLDMAEEGGELGNEPAKPASRIKLKGGSEPKPSADKPSAEKKGVERQGASAASHSRITLLESGEAVIEDQAEGEQAAAEDGEDRKVTPLDEPSL